MPSPRQLDALKVAVFAVALVPVMRLVHAVVFDPSSLGANPAESIVRSTGDWTLRFLLVTLAVTPVRRLTGFAWLIRLRRMLGLFAFFYGVVHLSSYVAFDHVFDMGAILKDILKRPFITVGFAALVLMAPLAATSTNAMVKRLGGKRWQALHRLVYPIAVLGVFHFWMLVKRDITEPAIYAVLLGLLLGYRAWAARTLPRTASGARSASVSSRRA